MFTGIVEEVGTIESVEPAGDGVVLTVRARTVLDGVALGDSISVDGVCQTVTGFTVDTFTVQAIGTTLGRTTFGDFRVGRRVNLERALPLGGRLGGHLVQGHVDAVGRVLSAEEHSQFRLIDVEVPDAIAQVTVLHGSIAINGVSLTVNALPSSKSVQVAIIPFTLDHTSLSDLRAGDAVNLEGDMIGKYVRHLLGRPAGDASSRLDGEPTDLLRSWGY